MIPITFYTFWLVWSTFIIGHASDQAQQDAARNEMRQFKETPHRLKIKDVLDKKDPYFSFKFQEN